MYRAYKFKLKPTAEQAQILVSCMGAGRWAIEEINRSGTHQIYACGDTSSG